MIGFIKNIFKPKVETLNTIYINKENILSNVENIKIFQPKADFFPVLKSNAYWHGIFQMIKILEWQNFPYLCVDSFPEYQIILKNSKFNIFLLSETLAENYKFFDFKRTTFSVYTLKTLEKLASFNKKIKIHLFLNTWMNREWFQENFLSEALEIIKNSKLELEWVMSHLYSADESQFKKSITQIIKFKKMYSIIEKKWFSPKYRHIWASSWILRINDEFFNAFRPGLILYWHNPLSFWIQWKTNLLKPALSIESTVTCLQKIEQKRDWVWYNHKILLNLNSIVWTVPFWYYEGFQRNFSNKLKFKINEKKFWNQVWMISMNMCNFRASKDTKVWDKIEVIWEDFFSENSLNKISANTHTSVYEILAKLNWKIRRKIK